LTCDKRKIGWEYGSSGSIPVSKLKALSSNPSITKKIKKKYGLVVYLAKMSLIYQGIRIFSDTKEFKKYSIYKYLLKER
jgi:hypothetical protein